MLLKIRTFATFLLILSILSTGFVVDVNANDLVPESDLSGGASVFVFRGSRKRPQERGAVRSFSSGGASVNVRRERVKNQIAVNRKKKADAAKARAAAVARARARERNQKLRLSNTLTATAEKQLAEGNLAGATVNFREALKANPKNADAMLGLSDALTATGITIAGDAQNDSAAVYFEEAVKLDPKNESAFAKLGEIHDAKGRNAQAIDAYEKALKLDPAFSSLYMPLGLAYAQEGKSTEAESYLNKAKAAGFDSPEARMARILILSMQGRDAEAIAMLDDVLRSEPQNASAHHQKAAIFGKTNQTDKAVSSYRDAVKIDPNMAAAWFDLGVIYYNQEKYADALPAYQTVVKIEPENYKAQANLASTFRQLERFAEANAAYKAAEPGNKNNPDLYSEWGYCLGKTNEWDKSTARLNTARELSPNAVDNNNAGWGYYNAARYDRANNVPPAESTAKLELGKQYLETAVQQDPKLDAAQFNLGATKNSMGDYEGAKTALNAALALRSDWVIALNQLGLAYRGSNDMTNALAQFQRVSALDANNAFGLVNLGEVYHLTGNKKEAKKVQDRLKKINPALANQLNSFFSGKAVVDDAKRQIENKVPKVPGIRFPFN
ncbi:MAG: tetratricopeptide repeat protein [Pyrinomonadaceae bacterium]